MDIQIKIRKNEPVNQRFSNPSSVFTPGTFAIDIAPDSTGSLYIVIGKGESLGLPVLNVLSLSPGLHPLVTTIRETNSTLQLAKVNPNDVTIKVDTLI